MAHPEQQWRDGEPKQEVLSPHDFYAAYSFDYPEMRKDDVIALVEEAYRLGYPIRYWWLSDAMDLQGSPDRLIICVHHPASDTNVGMDVYNALKEKGVMWDDLESAAFEEYRDLSRPIIGPTGILLPDGKALFPLDPAKNLLVAPPKPLSLIQKEDLPRDYLVFYSLSGETMVTASGEGEASETVFSKLAALVGRMDTTGITPAEASEVRLGHADVEIDSVEAVVPIESESPGEINAPQDGETQQMFFDVYTSITRGDLERLGYDASRLTDSEMKQLADRMTTAYMKELFWPSLNGLAQEKGLPKLAGGYHSEG